LLSFTFWAKAKAGASVRRRMMRRRVRRDGARGMGRGVNCMRSIRNRPSVRKCENQRRMAKREF